MKTTNEVRMTIESRSVNEAYARIAAAALVAPLDPTIDTLADIKTSVSECVTNSIVHGYPDILGKIYIVMRILDNRVFQIIIKDKGVGIADVDMAKMPCFTTKPSDERSGMGFSIMEAFMDKVRIVSKEGKGTTVTMWRKID